MVSLRGALTAVFLFAPAVHAQRVEGSLDVGGAALRYADTLSTGAATITPRVAATWASNLIEASGTYSQFTSGGWSTQGLFSASHFIPTERGLFGEVGGFAGGSIHDDGTRTGEFIANLRAHFPRGTSELFFGVGGGRTSDGFEGRILLLGEAGASIGSMPSSLLLTITPTMVSDSIKYADTQATLSWNRETVGLAALLGFRLGDQLTTLGAHARAWAHVSAVFHVTPRLGLVAAGGSYPVDPTQGFPGGKFISLSVRITRMGDSRQPAPVPVVAEPPSSDLTPATPAAIGFTATRSTGGAVILRVNAPGARVVEINGDFTNWTPIQLLPAEPGWWATKLAIKPGKYQMNLRIDGGQWSVPPGVLAMVDEFGGAVGLLVVE